MAPSTLQGLGWALCPLGVWVTQSSLIALLQRRAGAEEGDDVGSKPGLPFPSGATLDHWLPIYLSLHFLICQMGTTVPILGWIKWDNSSAFIESIHYVPEAFLGNGGASGEDQVMTQWSLHSTGQHKNLEKTTPKKKNHFKGVWGPKRHYGKRMQGHTAKHCWLE